MELSLQQVKEVVGITLIMLGLLSGLVLVAPLLAYLVWRWRTTWVRAYRYGNKWYMSTIPTCEVCRRFIKTPKSAIVFRALVPYVFIPRGHAIWARLLEDSMFYPMPWNSYFFVSDTQVRYRPGPLYLCNACARKVAQELVFCWVNGELASHQGELVFKWEG